MPTARCRPPCTRCATGIRPESAAHLGAQLPLLLYGVHYENWRMAATPTKEHHFREFLDHVRRELPRDIGLDPERAACAVFDVVWEKVAPGEVATLAHVCAAHRAAAVDLGKRPARLRPGLSA